MTTREPLHRASGQFWTICVVFEKSDLNFVTNLVPRVSLLSAPLSLATGVGKKRDPGNGVALSRFEHVSRDFAIFDRRVVESGVLNHAKLDSFVTYRIIEFRM